jgi:hypothetical protein
MYRSAKIEDFILAVLVESVDNGHDFHTYETHGWWKAECSKCGCYAYAMEGGNLHKSSGVISSCAPYELPSLPVGVTKFAWGNTHHNLYFEAPTHVASNQVMSIIQYVATHYEQKGLISNWTVYMSPTSFGQVGLAFWAPPPFKPTEIEQDVWNNLTKLANSHIGPVYSYPSGNGW